MKNLSLILVLALLGTRLHSQITVSTTLFQADIDSYAWPITIAGGNSSNPVVVTLGENIFLADQSRYFIIQSDYVTLNGNNKAVSLYSGSSYPGLVRNGTNSSSGFSFITVMDLTMLCSSTNMVSAAGWIGQEYFAVGATDCIISNCSSNGIISSNGGGMAGRNSSCTVSRSHSSGSIGTGGGGIVGYFSNGNAVNCYSTGNISTLGGGIFGRNASGTASDCYSRGSIASRSGGIMGYASGGSISNCYSSGSITNLGGGISSQFNTATIINCYSTGIINTGGGGIAGQNNSGSISNCYTTGAFGGSNGIVASGTPPSSSFGQNGTWNDINASLYLSSPLIDIDLTSNTVPFRLKSFDSQLYSPATENLPIAASIESPAPLDATGTYSLISVNTLSPTGYPTISINVSTGVITFTSTPIGSYAVEVLWEDASNIGYEIPLYTLNILSTLPISWRSFTVTPRNKTAFLEWSTSSEVNTRDFTVQYSKDGNTWVSVHSLPAARNSSNVSYYSFIHPNPVNGNNYYRILQTDLDGKSSYSSVQKMKLTLSTRNFTVMNTLVYGGLLKVNMVTPGTLSLYSNDGRLIMKKSLTAGIQEINLGVVPKGVYFVRENDTAEKILVR